jgi:hypothetical protein
MFDFDTVGLEAGESQSHSSQSHSSQSHSSQSDLSQSDSSSEDELILRIMAELEAAPDPEPSGPDWTHVGGRHGGFPSLEALPADMALAAIVFTTDRSRLSGYDLVRLLQAEDRLMSAVQSRRLRTIGDISEVFGDSDSAAAEVGAALHLTRAASEADVRLAEHLGEHPRVWGMLRSGDIDMRRAKVIVDGLTGIERETAEAVLDQVLPDASELTTGQLRARLSRTCLELDPDAARARYEAGLEQRRVVLTATPDTTAILAGHDLPPDLAAAAARRINWLARKAKTRNDPRTLDQIRADVFLDLLTGRSQALHGTTSGGPVGHVDIVADIETLTGASDAPAHIPGYGPVIAEIARKTVAHQTDCRWEYTVTDQGRPIATGTIRRRPTESMKRRIRSQCPTCVWPGCRMPARQSDLDHRHRWARGGRTTLRNLAPLCDRHHGLLDKGWHYQPAPDGGYAFTSPLGHTYISSGRSP